MAMNARAVSADYMPEENRQEKFFEAFKKLQEDMEGEFERLGCPSDEEIVQMMKEIRRELYYEKNPVRQ